MEHKRCIECEEIELARVRDDLPGQTLPIPYAALDGFPTGKEPHELTRRKLMQWGVAGFAAVYGAKTLNWGEVWESVAAASETATDKCLVLIYLAGGNDGLNLILPNEGVDYAAYKAARPEIHRTQGPTPADPVTAPFSRIGSTPLPGPGGQALAFSNVVVSKNGGGDNSRTRWGFAAGGDDFGLDTLYGPGDGEPATETRPGSDLAIMPAVDAKKYSLSHFDNSDIWFSASNDQNIKTGWLGRWIDRNGNKSNPLQAVSIDTALSKAIRTKDNPVCAIPSLPMTGFVLNSSNYGGVNTIPPANSPDSAITINLNPRIDKLSEIGAGADNAYLERSRTTYGLAVETYQRSKDETFVPGAGYPNTSASTTTLTNKLRTAAHLLAANLGTRVITIHWGGFDTHTGQVASQDKQLVELSRSLGAFRADLQRRGIEQKVCTLVFSEFGRRVKENGAGDTAGTDHGAGGLMMAMGSGVRGGFASVWPGCETNELTSGNLQVPTDYRSVYLAVVEEWLGDDDPAGLIGGGAIETLIRGDGKTGRRLFK